MDNFYTILKYFNMPEISCLVYTSVFFDDFINLKMEFERGLKDYSQHYEIRYDLFKYRSTVDLKQILKYLNNNNIDYIFTFRSANLHESLKIYNTALDYTPPIIDVDIGSFHFNRSIFKESNLMLSFHGLNNDDVRLRIEKLSNFTPDIYKIALLYTDTGKFLKDLAYLYNYKLEKSAKLAYVPMGNNNSFMRIISALTVSDYAYASYKATSAPGQIETYKFMSLLNSIRGKYE